MNTVFTIFKKELIDTLRDRRTLLMMVVIPMLLFPVLMTIVTKVASSQIKKAQKKVLKVGLRTYGNAEAFRTTLMDREDLQIREDIPPDRIQIQDLIQADSLDATILFAKDFDRKVADLQPGTIELYFKSSEDLNIARRRLRDLLEDFEKELLSDRFKKLYLDENVVEAIDIEMNDVASTKEKLGKTIGGFLPYIFVLFCFMGSMYPAIDLGAGEKERGTLETLLVSPASRLQILLGKFGVVMLAGILSAAISVLGLFVAVQFVAAQQTKKIPSELLNAIYGIFEVSSILLVLSLLLLLTVFFAAGLLSLSIFAKSFKEAQSLLSPLSIVVIVPVFIGMLPGMTLNTTTALIPVLNVSLATKEIISGTITPGLLAEVYASLLLLAALSLYGCSRWFEREGTIFRSS